MELEVLTEVATRATDGRSCQSIGCTLCCKVLAVEELNKDLGEWCTHCARGTGCTIYGQHPESCRTFLCSWLADPNWPEELDPRRTQCVVTCEYVNSGPREVPVIRIHENAFGAFSRHLSLFTMRLWNAAQGFLSVVVYDPSRNVHVMVPDRENGGMTAIWSQESLGVGHQNSLPVVLGEHLAGWGWNLERVRAELAAQEWRAMLILIVCLLCLIFFFQLLILASIQRDPLRLLSRVILRDALKAADPLDNDNDENRRTTERTAEVRPRK